MMLWRVTLFLGYREAAFDFANADEATAFAATVMRRFNPSASDGCDEMKVSIKPVMDEQKEE